MLKRSFPLLACLLAAPATAQSAAQAPQAPQAPATLVGHAALPALTFVDPPQDAGPMFKSVGKFAAADRRRVDEIGKLPTTDFASDPKAPRGSNVALPVAGQVVQGWSGLVSLGQDRFLALNDNGLGGKANSPDCLLMVSWIKADFDKGTLTRENTIFLRDPDKKVPFRIENENSPSRYLTGADFDPESIQKVGDVLFIGDEFGPYLLKTDLAGKVLAFYETVVDGKPLRGPDHYLNNALPAIPGAPAPFEVRRSRGFESMALSPDGKTLYPMFEGPLYDNDKKAFEPFVRVLAFDVDKAAFSDTGWRYKMEDAANSIGDFQLLDATTGVLIERDDATEGAREQACVGASKPDCFHKPAAFKRVYKVDFSQKDADGHARKVAYVDLTRIEDPNGRSRLGPKGPIFALPHLGPEGLALVDAKTIAVVNDNNFPYSVGRALGAPDDDELTLIDVSALVAAK
jgi:hypothetical protein